MAYCPNCGDEIALDALSCPTCDAVFGNSGAWRPLHEPPPDRDFKRIAEFRSTREQQRQTQKPVITETQKREIEATVKKNRHTMLVLALSYLITCFVGAVVLCVSAWNTPGALLGLFLLFLFPILPIFLLGIGWQLMMYWIFGFAICWFLVSGLLSAKRSGEDDD